MTEEGCASSEPFWREGAFPFCVVCQGCRIRANGPISDVFDGT